jgi:hypothetical protein
LFPHIIVGARLLVASTLLVRLSLRLLLFFFLSLL